MPETSQREGWMDQSDTVLLVSASLLRLWALADNTPTLWQILLPQTTEARCMSQIKECLPWEVHSLKLSWPKRSLWWRKDTTDKIENGCQNQSYFTYAFFCNKKPGKNNSNKNNKTTKQAAAHNVSWGEKAKLDPCIFASCAWSMQEAGYSCRDLSLLSELKISSLSTWAHILRVNLSEQLLKRRQNAILQ